MSKRILLDYILIIGLIVLSSGAQAKSLVEVLHHAIHTHPQVRASIQNRLSIDQAVVQSKAGLLPKVTATMSYGPTKSHNSNTLGYAGGSSPIMPARNANLTVNQLLFDGSATKSDMKRNIARANSAAYQINAVVQDTAFAAVQAYLEVLEEKDLVALAENNVKEHRHIEHTVRLRVRSGISTRADLIQVEGRVALAESNLLAEYSNQRDAMARYYHATGEYPDNPILPMQVKPSALPHSRDEAIAIALKNHPTVLSAQYDIKAAYSQHQNAMAANFPKVIMQAGLDRNANVGGIRGSSMDQFLVANLSYDVFTSGAVTGRQRETAHLLEQAHEILHNSYLQVREDTTFSWDQYATAIRDLPYLKEHSDSTVDTIVAYKKQFTLGKRTLLDLLDVQNEMFASKRAYIQGQYKIYMSQFQLLHSMGHLTNYLHLPLPEEAGIYQS